MRNLWLVARHEFERTVLRRSFLVVTLALPLLLVGVTALAVFAQTAGESRAPVGYVDHAGVLNESLQSTLPDAAKRIPIRSFADEQAAQAALEAGEIQAFFVLPAGYPTSLSTELYYLSKPPSDSAWQQFDDLVRASLVSSYSPEVQKRVLEGPTILVRDVTSGRSFGGGSDANIVLPLVATMVFFLAVMSASSYMLQVVADEKENRTIEVLVTSLTPGQIIAGKTIGLLGAAIGQLAIFAVAACVGVWIARPYVPALQQLVVPWDYMGVMVLFFFPTYVLVSAVMIAIGSAVTEVQQGQQIAGILSLFFMLPIFLLYLIFQNPGSPLAMVFTLFPTWSFVTISVRWALGTVPLWQIGASWVLLVAGATLTVWAASRIFRAGMLRYGQTMTLQGLVTAVRGR